MSGESGGARAAPFTYGRRRYSVFGTGENIADALHANHFAQQTDSAAKERHRIHDRLSSRLGGGHTLDMTAAVHGRARLSSVLDGDILQFAATAAGATAGGGGRGFSSTSQSSSPHTLSTSFPPLVVDPVPGCLRPLHYTRSARAWDTLALGCLAEATQLSEQDNDVIAWAACLILGGDAQRGLMLLESYVVATCVVVHEVLTGVLGRLPKGVNPFSKRTGDQDDSAPVRDDTANPYVQRKCLKRHNQVLMAWMRYRSMCSEKLPDELASCDVNAAHTPEAVVQQVVLQSMQLVDAVEVHRWYIVALMLFVPADVGDAGDATLGDGTGTKSRRASPSTATGDDGADAACLCDDGKKRKGEQGNRNGGGNGRASPAIERANETDSIFSQTRSMRSVTGAAAGDGTGTTHTSASDGYRAPQNLWFRFFFALDECGVALHGDPRRSSQDDDTDGSVTPLAPTSDEEDGGDARTSAAVAGEGPRASRSRRVQGRNNDAFRPASPRRSNHGAGAQPDAVGPSTAYHADTNAAASASAVEGCRGSRSRGSHVLQSSGKLARTLSRFRERGGNRTSSSQSARNSAAASFRDGGGAPTVKAPTVKAPTWYLRATVSLDQEQTCSLLLSHLYEWDVYFVTAVTAFYTHHNRTSMLAASRFLHWAVTNGGLSVTGGSPGHVMQQNTSTFPPQNAVAPGLQRYQCRFAVFLRAWSALQIGERLQAGKDIISLLEDKEDSLSYHVGCALALYGLPLPQARDSLLIATHQFTNATVKATGPGAPAPTSFSTLVQGYLYLLAEAVHATTLLQLGLVQQVMEVTKVALQRAETCGLTEEDTLPLGALRDVLVTAATAMEDSNTILDVPLSPHRLVYLAVCPAFFGGLCSSGIRVKARSATYRILYPQNLPLYASVRQAIPFHMNRATFLYHAGQVESAWDDACCAVAAVDEVAGSVEFAFSDCFPLRVYYFAVTVGLTLLESLLAADLEAAKACLANPEDQKAVEEKDVRLQEDELLSKEIMHICRDIVQRMQYFFPHSRLTELCRAQISIVCGGKDYLAQAVALSHRYPYSPSAQNVLTLALYFDHHIPEAVDNARKNLQTFPHSNEVIYLHRKLQKKHVTYNFNYRKLLPTRYKPGSHDRVFTKRMIVIFILLAANLAVLCLTVYVNIPTITNMPGGLRYLAVRMQLPTVAPLFFAAIFVIHAIVAAATTKNLIATLLTDLFFVNTPLNRALFCLRCIPLVNLVNALLVSILGNNFLFESGSATFVLYFFLAILFVPFTTRIWFLPSIDEPDVGFMSLLAILSVDTVVAIFIVVPHIIAAFLEPYMLILFYFFAPTERPSNEKGFQLPSSSIRRRLLLHAHDSKSMPQRFTTGSGSHFLHIIVLRWLYVWSHCTMETRFLAESQLEAECYRVFPLVEGEDAEVLYAQVSPAPLCAAITATEDSAPHTSSMDDTTWRRSDIISSSSRPPTSSFSQEAAHAGGDGSTAANAPLRHRQYAFSASSSSSSASASRSSGSDSSRSDSIASSTSSPNSFTGGGVHSRRTISDVDDNDSSNTDFDGTLLAGVRTVDAMRQLLDSTTRDRSSAMRHTASFVRPNTLHTRGFFSVGNKNDRSNPSEDDEEVTDDPSGFYRKEGDKASASNAKKGSRDPRRADLLEWEISNGGNDTYHEYYSNGDGDGDGISAPTTRYSEDIFGRNVDAHPHHSPHCSPHRGNPTQQSATPYNGARAQQRGEHSDDSSISSSSSSSVSDVASYYADEQLDLLHHRSATRAHVDHDHSDGEVAEFPVYHAGAARTPASADANSLYTDDYAAQNGFGWFTHGATGEEAGRAENSPSRSGEGGLDF
jgi:hypothetical protein